MKHNQRIGVNKKTVIDKAKKAKVDKLRKAIKNIKIPKKIGKIGGKFDFSNLTKLDLKNVDLPDTIEYEKSKGRIHKVRIIPTDREL
jgi:hypothetical protein